MDESFPLYFKTFHEVRLLFKTGIKHNASISNSGCTAHSLGARIDGKVKQHFVSSLLEYST